MSLVIFRSFLKCVLCWPIAVQVQIPRGDGTRVVSKGRPGPALILKGSEIANVSLFDLTSAVVCRIVSNSRDSRVRSLDTQEGPVQSLDTQEGRVQS